MLRLVASKTVKSAESVFNKEMNTDYSDYSDTSPLSQ